MTCISSFYQIKNIVNILNIIIKSNNKIRYYSKGNDKVDLDDNSTKNFSSIEVLHLLRLDSNNLD
jgi:hypothetical protein